MKDRILDATREALFSVRNPRFYSNERGYQGRLYCLLQTELENRDLVNDDRIIEMEYQKSHRHGMAQRPDIVFHIPAEISGAGVRENNYAVWALKPAASAAVARSDFDKLDEMFEILNYPLGIFINIRSNNHHLDSYNGPYGNRLVAFAVSLINGEVLIRQAEYTPHGLREDRFKK
jgi:hypothetical protein